MKLAALFLFYYASFVLGQEDGHNWKVFVNIEEPDYNEIINFIKELPITGFWDSLKGEYRTSIVGEQLENLSNGSTLFRICKFWLQLWSG